MSSQPLPSPIIWFVPGLFTDFPLHASRGILSYPIRRITIVTTAVNQCDPMSPRSPKIRHRNTKPLDLNELLFTFP
jgi:hypothetical protein